MKLTLYLFQLAVLLKPHFIQNVQGNFMPQNFYLELMKQFRVDGGIFWLNNGDINNRDEIDICENNSKPSITSQVNRPYTMYSQYFLTVDGNDERAHGNFDNRNLSQDNPLNGVKWNEEYHTLGAYWIDKNNVQFYLNGEPAGKVTTNRDFTRDLNIIWDL